MQRTIRVVSFFFFNDTATTEIYTLSLHDALPIYADHIGWPVLPQHREKARKHAVRRTRGSTLLLPDLDPETGRSEEHTSELQSRSDLVCRLLLEKKKTT